MKAVAVFPQIKEVKVIEQDAPRLTEPDHVKVRMLEIGICGTDKEICALETHVALLKIGIWIIEGLDLSQVDAGTYELICLPIKIKGSDGGPARAILRKREDARTVQTGEEH